MLYKVFKVIVQLSLSAYFKRIEIIGKEHIEEGRAVYVCNHPGAMIDPILIAMSVRKPFHYITGAEWFGKGLKRWLFQDQFNMIPVYRPWLNKDRDARPQSNEDMFQACYESLERGDRIMIYPEASSMTVPWIRELKTGAARIKIGGDAYLNKKGDTDGKVKIIPIGINYENPHRFQTRATIVVGEPIDFSGIEVQGDLVVAAREMTERIRVGMQACVLHMVEEAYYPVVKNVIKLMEPQVIKDLDIDPKDPATAFQARKEIIRAIEFHKRSSGASFEKLEHDIQHYIDRYEAEGFRHYNPFDATKRGVVLQTIFVILMLPFFLLGFMLNALPYAIARWMFRTLLLEKVTGEHKQGDLNPAFAGSLAYAVGVGVFIIWYILLAGLSAMLYTWWVAIPLVCFLSYQSGRVALLYLRWLKRLRDVWHWNRMGERKRKEMLEERQRLFRILHLLKLRFVKAFQTTD